MNIFVKKVKELQEKAGKIYIYGAGLYAQRVYKLLKEKDVSVQGFVVTSDIQCNNHLFDLQVLCIQEIDLNGIGIVVGANRRNSIEILKVLEEKNCNDDKIICACEYLDNRELDAGYYEAPTIEITTVIGCKVNCKYCPQKLLLKNYFQNDVQRDSIMTMDMFIACLDNLPEKCNIQFCGMAEPFLNPICSDMIIKAYEAGKNIELYTTLVGVTQPEIEKIWDIPLYYVNIHVADVNGYADIPVTSEYLELLDKVINHKRIDGSSFVNLCNAQGEPHPKVKELCKGKLDISTVLHDRAGNLEEKNLIHKQNDSGVLSCTLCGQDLNHNVLLPDGTLLLCCMDYGMKHKLGNLAEQTYDAIIKGKELTKIQKGLMGDEEIDILCRNCSNATRID